MSEESLQKHSDRRPVSVFIATLGGSTLSRTIELLNSGTVVPAEILVCVPEMSVAAAGKLAFPNVTIVRTVVRGQVAQRAVGFQQASHDLVMQLDDDMFVDEYCIAHLIGALLQHPDAAVAPALINVATNESVYKKPSRGALVEKIYYWLMNGTMGYREGRIEKSGSPVGIDPARENKDLYEVEWLAGGCVMHFKKNLVLHNFYPFSGKAYCEDILHSHFLRRKKIRMLVVPQARCGLEVETATDAGWRQFMKEIFADFKARRYFMRLDNRGCARMYLFYAIRIGSYVNKTIVRRLRQARIEA